MDKDRFKRLLPRTALAITEKCMAGALVVAGVAGVAATDASAVTTQTQDISRLETTQAQARQSTSLEGAILLDIVRENPATGEQIAQHYSHASHASHASHYSSH